MNRNTATIIERNINSLQSNLRANLKYIDFNYKYRDKDSFVLKDGDALINEFKIWLMSEKHDYLRNPNAGGFCEGNLNRYRFSPDSEPAILSELKEKAQENFPLIEILEGSRVACDIKRRGWVFHLILRDKLTGMLADMRNNGIVVPAFAYPEEY
jgi:hypothetical protein